MMKGEELKKQLRGGVIVDGRQIEAELSQEDKKLIWELNEVFHRHGWEGKLREAVFDCGTPSPTPEEKPRCHRICISGKKDEPICFWYCY